MNCLVDRLLTGQCQALTLADLWQESRKGIEASHLHSIENQWRLASADDAPEKRSGHPWPERASLPASTTWRRFRAKNQTLSCYLSHFFSLCQHKLTSNM